MAFARSKPAHLGRIVMQIPRPSGVWTGYESGAWLLLPYKVDSAGARSVNLLPGPA